MLSGMQKMGLGREIWVVQTRLPHGADFCCCAKSLELLHGPGEAAVPQVVGCSGAEAG